MSIRDRYISSMPMGTLLHAPYPKPVSFPRYFIDENNSSYISMDLRIPYTIQDSSRYVSRTAFELPHTNPYLAEETVLPASSQSVIVPNQAVYGNPAELISDPLNLNLKDQEIIREENKSVDRNAPPQNDHSGNIYSDRNDIYTDRNIAHNDSNVYTDRKDDSVEMMSPDSVSDTITTASDNSYCGICADKATGKHYGAHSCDGCKGFFRRSVRKNHNYTCRFTRNCIINKSKRNQCRFCRFRKCIKAGMKKEAVQNERDRISHRKLSSSETSVNISVNLLLKAEDYLKSKKQMLHVVPLPVKNMKVAEVDDVCKSMRQQLIALVEWAQYIPAFQELTSDDKISLLRARAGEHLLLGAAWRSKDMDDVLVLGNNCIIPRDSSGMSSLVVNIDPEIKRIGLRVMNELVRTFRETNMDESEYVCLKALVFFDPSIRGLKEIDKVKKIRYCIQLLLEEYITDRLLDSKGRFGQLLLSLQVLQSITWQMVEQIQFAELFGSAKIDSLLAEMLLGEIPKPDDKSESLSLCDSQMGGFTSAIDSQIGRENFLHLVQIECKKEQMSPNFENISPCDSNLP